MPASVAHLAFLNLRFHPHQYQHSIKDNVDGSFKNENYLDAPACTWDFKHIALAQNAQQVTQNGNL